MFCEHCGAKVPDNAKVCIKCGCAVLNVAARLADTDESSGIVRMLVPVGRSGWAIAAGYMGLFSLIPFLIPGVLAVVFGVLGLKDIKAHPEKHGAGRAWFGIIMGALSIPLSLFIMLAGAAS